MPLANHRPSTRPPRIKSLRWFRGTCSNCRQRHKRVKKVLNCQICKSCAARLHVPRLLSAIWGRS